MKRFLSVFLSVALIFSLAGCGCNKNETTPDKEENATEEATEGRVAISIEETLEEYFTAYEAYDFEKAGEYLLDKSAIKDVSAELDVVIDDFFVSFGMNAIMTENAFESMKTMVKDVYEKSLEYMSVEVPSVTEDGDEATAKVNIKYIPVETIIGLSMSEPFGVALENSGYGSVEDPQTLTDEDWAKIISELSSIMEDVVGNEEFMSVSEVDMELLKKDGIWYIDIE